MKLRVGIEGRRRPVFEELSRLGAPALVSANSLWTGKRWRVSKRLAEVKDLALDSGGFMAHKAHGGFRWTVEQYGDLVQALRPCWWAQMDWCCEPELAADPGKVSQRIDKTVAYLWRCRAMAAERGIAAPLPVLQGWRPSDYTQGPAFERGFEWPELVGVGSVCRRQVRGADGLLAVLAAIDKAVPAGVQLHLFGVKSEGLQAAGELFPGRVASADSMAWNFGARKDAYKGGFPCSNQYRAARMGDWYRKQTGGLEQTEEKEV